MKKIILTTTLLFIGILIICAGAKSPKEFYEMFAKMTKYKMLLPTELKDLVENKNCVLISSKNYTGVRANTSKGDIKNTAKGVDEYIELEGGNAYLLKNYKWDNYDNFGTKHLVVDFDIYKCKL